MQNACESSSVSPVPGGPYMRTPLGGLMPRLTNLNITVSPRKVGTVSPPPVLVGHGQHHRLHQLLDLLVQAADVAVLLGRPGVHLHGLHPAVVLRGQGVQDEVTVLVNTHQVTWRNGYTSEVTLRK